MTDHPHLARSSSNLSQSHSASSSVRPRNRRPINAPPDDDADEPGSRVGSGLLSAFSPSTSRSVSPFPTANTNKAISRSAGGSPNRGGTTSDLGQFFSETLTTGWSSVQDITTTFFSNVGQGKTLLNSRTGPQPPSSRQSPRGRRLSPQGDRKAAASWGPAPPSKKPAASDVAAGSLAQREAALKAAKTASVLESHDGVNGGLDVSGKHKRRNSDEIRHDNRQDDDYLVYVHKVQPEDTYAGLILRYKCREDAFRRANGLWSRDTIQTRRWLTIPVAACDIRGRPCDPPSDVESGKDNDKNGSGADDLDLLSRTPESNGAHPPQTYHDDYFNKSADESSSSNKQDEEEDDKPWTHLRWVKIDSIPEPVEIGRVARGTMGYFPPRRRRSIRTVSSVSTPRQSIELPESVTDGPSPRRPSSLSSRPQFSGTPTSGRSRIGSDAGGDVRPAWMKRPGGVGTMGRNAKAPGPDKDVLHSWTRKHMPGLNIEMPSMAITGSELAKLGFQSDPDIAKTAYADDGRYSSNNSNGNGFDRAASTVETWVRGAWAKRPGTPLMRAVGGDRVPPSDLIELADTTSDDGRGAGGDRQPPGPGNLIRSVSMGATGQNDGLSSLRGRPATNGGGRKGGKAD